MKQFQIAVEHKHNGLLRKTLTLPITDEMASHIARLSDEMDKRLEAGQIVNDPKTGFAIDGHRNIKIGISVMDVCGTF